MRLFTKRWLRNLAGTLSQEARKPSSTRPCRVGLPSRPVLQLLEARDMPGDVLGGFFLPPLGVLPNHDPLPGREPALNVAPDQIALASPSLPHPISSSSHPWPS